MPHWLVLDLLRSGDASFYYKWFLLHFSPAEECFPGFFSLRTLRWLGSTGDSQPEAHTRLTPVTLPCCRFVFSLSLCHCPPFSLSLSLSSLLFNTQSRTLCMDGRLPGTSASINSFFLFHDGIIILMREREREREQKRERERTKERERERTKEREKAVIVSKVTQLFFHIIIIHIYCIFFVLLCLDALAILLLLQHLCQ